MTPGEIRTHRELIEGHGRPKGIKCSCDMCGRTRDVKAIEHHEGPIWLCPGCNARVNHLPEKLDEITELFLIGNAL